MTRQPSGIIFALCLIACFTADTAPLWAVVSLVGIAGLALLVLGVAGVVTKEKSTKKDRHGGRTPKRSRRIESDQNNLSTDIIVGLGGIFNYEISD